MNHTDGAQPLESLIAAVERTLAETFGGSVRLGRDESLRGSDRSRVMRWQVLEAPESAPTSVIIKHVQGDDDHPYDPDDAPPGSPAWRFFNDWLGAQFLSAFSGDPPVCPRFYGGDRARGFIVLEDLGEGESLADLLQGEDPVRAEQGLMAFAATVGRMHAATVGRKAEFDLLLDALGASALEGPAPAEDELRRFSRFHEGCDALNYRLSARFDEELDTVWASMQNPGPFLAYTHGDPCPDNDRCFDGHLRLFDFEFGAFRHALYDGVYGRVPFPTCWCVNRLPPDIPPRMEAVYRAELVQGCPEAGDDAIFHRAMVEACAYWTIRTTGWHLPDALKEDGEWGIATIRQRVLVRLDNIAALTEEFGYLEALGAAAHEIAAQLRALWPPEADQMPLYPAFRTKL